MQGIIVIVLFALALMMGGLCGITPGVQYILHINMWFIIPVGGLLLGAMVGGLQWLALFKTNVQLTKPVIAVLCLSGAAAYFAADYADYYTYTYENEGQNVQLREVATFGQFMDVRLSKTNLKIGHSTTDKGIELGGGVTKAFYLVDLVGGFLGALFVFYMCSIGYPYCARCSKYLQLTYKKKLRVQEEATFKTTLDTLIKAIADRNGDTVRHTLENTPSEKKALYLVHFESRGCPACAQGHVFMQPSVRNKNNWVAINELTVREKLDSPLIRTVSLPS